jgi:putative transposase
MNGHRKACRRFNEPGHAHLLTLSCFCRRPFLSKDRSRMWLVEAIDRAREKHAFDLWAYVVMPELNGNSRRI